MKSDWIETVTSRDVTSISVTDETPDPTDTTPAGTTSEPSTSKTPTDEQMLQYNDESYATLAKEVNIDQMVVVIDNYMSEAISAANTKYKPNKEHI